jgi:hypothetical protein
VLRVLADPKHQALASRSSPSFTENMDSIPLFSISDKYGSMLVRDPISPRPYRASCVLIIPSLPGSESVAVNVRTVVSSTSASLEQRHSMHRDTTIIELVVIPSILSLDLLKIE